MNYVNNLKSYWLFDREYTFQIELIQKIEASIVDDHELEQSKYPIGNEDQSWHQKKPKTRLLILWE